MKFYITATSYVLMSLPCMPSSFFKLRFFIGWFGHKYQKFSRTNVWIWLFCFKYLLFYILSVFLFLRSDSISEIWYLFQIHLRKRNRCTQTPSYLGNLSVASVAMSVNSLQPTILCVITLCVYLSSLYGQDVPFLDFFVLFVVVVVAVIVVRNHLWEWIGWS